MIELRGLDLPLEAGTPAGEHIVRTTVARRLGLAEEHVATVKVLKRSVDARRTSTVHFVAALGVTLAAGAPESEPEVVARVAHADVAIAEPREAFATARLSTPPLTRPVVVGTGPAGLFAALTLARAGARPVVLERGLPVEERIASVGSFVRGGALDPESNIQFGEGGAGTFSDGKLTTNTRNPRIRSVLESLVEAGAPEEILWQANPHIGTDRLTGAVRQLRHLIESLGGELRFSTRLSDLVIDPHTHALRAVVTDGVRRREEFAADALVLATGHSARDTFELLHERGAVMVPKPFSIGVRIEHDQRMIDRTQYGSSAGHPALGAAEYKLSCHLQGGRSAYTFCMCPGGEVVAAASEPGGVVTNGMSRFARDGANANSAFLVNAVPGDFGSDHPLAGVEFQRTWERAAFELGGRDYRAPAQLLGDFVQGVASSGAGGVVPSYPLGVRYTDLAGCLPPFAVQALREAAGLLDRRMRGFAAPDAVLTGVESRSSSPVRVPRDDSWQSNLRGVYPCGEGAGYAGGIMSAAVDGMRCAEAVLERYA